MRGKKWDCEEEDEMVRGKYAVDKVWNWVRGRELERQVQVLRSSFMGRTNTREGKGKVMWHRRRCRWYRDIRPGILTMRKIWSGGSAWT